MCLTETKIAKTKNKKFYNNQHFTYYWSNSSTSKEGTCILIRNNLQPHIHNILNHPGGAIAIDLFFKHNYKFRIISIYLSSTNNSIRQQTQSTIITWIQQALQQQLHIIILGDFNSSIQTTISNATKYQLLNYLHSINMYDLANHTNNTDATWQSSRYNSRIDYIWASEQTILFLNKFQIDDSSRITNSDHQMLIAQWTFPFAINKPRKKNKCKRRTFNYKVMTKEKWEDFSN